ncbi:hypothetical protein RHGRI_021204 [Rhododendron griersonianum]|uniref:Secreted protein n=1 Tax=Rhododendron griersonianum TaxID=479676 RepID=A0AAV6JQE4_9ERIC|nr:hypothetical protein RHGRI_021204 [Rhododendron griersonianum]
MLWPTFFAPSTTLSYLSCFFSTFQSLCLRTPFGYRNRRTLDIADWFIHQNFYVQPWCSFLTLKYFTAPTQRQIDRWNFITVLMKKYT